MYRRALDTRIYKSSVDVFRFVFLVEHRVEKKKEA